MKKLLFPVLSLFALALVSCNNGQDLSRTRKDEVVDSIRTEYKIDFTEDGVRLETDSRVNQSSYYDVYVHQDVKTNLVKYSFKATELKDTALTFDDAIESNRFKGVNVTALVFNDNTYTDEATAILKEVYDSTYGLGKVNEQKVSELIGITVTTKNAWTQNMDAEALVRAYKDGKKDINVEIAYLPVFVHRQYNNITVLQRYVFVPVAVNYIYNNQKIVVKDNTYELVENDLKDITAVEFRWNPQAGKGNLLAEKPLADYEA
ncbi:MAG: hypothetical protein IJU60_02950 [Acholeplasmatales bacterium]|nr:hypothetical protein [Acholeplasmatales bacterium]